jgi:hypothetical protein
MTADHAPDIDERAERLYAARSALAETKTPKRCLGIAELVQFLNDPQRSLTMEEQRSLFGNLQLRADYRRLKSQLVIAAELPALAAASTGDVNSRRFDGGTVSIHRSRVPGQIYVLLRFSASFAPSHAMLLEGSKGDLIKRSLPPADANGDVMLVLDEKNDSDARFLRLLSDPTSTGAFLA